jgi:uncharacterized membrane protein YhaH (DUF805 family)
MLTQAAIFGLVAAYLFYAAIAAVRRRDYRKSAVWLVFALVAVGATYFAAQKLQPTDNPIDWLIQPWPCDARLNPSC